MNKKILLIGGSGFIGSHFQEMYPQAQIINLDLEQPTFSSNSTYYQGDIRKQENIDKVLSKHQDIDTIINLAAEHQDFGISREEYFHTNEGGSKMVCLAASRYGIQNIIFYSSVAVYGDNPFPSYEEKQPNPSNDYGASKLAAEKVYKHWATKDAQRSVLIIRPSVVYGERNVANMYRLISQIKKGLYCHIGQGNNIKSIVYVKNIVAATLYLIDRMKKGVSIYNYADGQQLTSKEIGDTIADALQKRRPISLPYGLIYSLGLPFDLIIKLTGKNLPISTSRIKKLCTATHHLAEKIKATGYQPIYSNREGLKRMVQWMLAGEVMKIQSLPIDVVLKKAA